MGQRAFDVEFGQTVIKGDRSGVFLDQLGDRLGEAARPGVRVLHGDDVPGLYVEGVSGQRL
ncbi:hypothetical protein D3C72_2195730 [compost metagenome]